MESQQKWVEITKTRKQRISEQQQLFTKKKRLRIAKYALAGTIASSAYISTGIASAFASQATYMVQQGDTLSHIAKNHGVTVKQIKEANLLASDLIKVNQRLHIPIEDNKGKRFLII